ncbi:hypothetical protein CK203_116951 [Vitis vinifera]|uniref:Uncharacterized protein n=1 Tax=Vitis vinifera TaxID=29760 RepID=A0A438D406_VITVI|nr:hypothetical protein CK203_116951 [Vitis vinifera]
MWLKEEGFKDVLQTWWEGLNFRRSASFVFAAKLQALKSLLKNWNREVLRSSVSGMSFERLEDQKVVGLEEPFSDKEIFGALSNFSGDKALVLIPKKGGTEDLRDFRLITKGSRNIHSSPSPTIGFNFRKISSSQECFQHLSSVKYELEVWPFNSWRIKNSPSTKAPRTLRRPLALPTLKLQEICSKLVLLVCLFQDLIIVQIKQHTKSQGLVPNLSMGL